MTPEGQSDLKRVADALERIANALELANYQKAFPPQPQPYSQPAWPTPQYPPYYTGDPPPRPGYDTFTYTNVSDVTPKAP